MNNSSEILVRMTLASWDLQNKRFLELIDMLSDEVLAREIAPGKNTGVYLLGHMTASHEAMMPLMGLGEMKHPELEEIFLRSPDKSGKTFPATSDLRAWLKESVQDLREKFSGLGTEEWLSRHNAVSSEDFAKEPMRNKLNVVIVRTAHLASHMGQMLYLRS